MQLTFLISEAGREQSMDRIEGVEDGLQNMQSSSTKLSELDKNKK